MHSARCLSGSLATTSYVKPLVVRAPRPGAGRTVLRTLAVLDLSRPAGRAAAVSQSPPTVDPAAGSDTRVVGVHSPAEFDNIIQTNRDKLVVLMCKAKCCRPCKMFTRKYKLIADHYSDALFYEIYGDESKDTRQMMIRMGVKVTPYFALYRNGERVHGHGGVNEANLHKAIQAHLLEGEAGSGSYSLASDSEEED